MRCGPHSLVDNIIFAVDTMHASWWQASPLTPRCSSCSPATAGSECTAQSVWCWQLGTTSAVQSHTDDDCLEFDASVAE